MPLIFLVILPPIGEVTAIAIPRIVNEVLAHAFAEVAENLGGFVELVPHRVDVTTLGDPLGKAFWSEEATLDELIDQLASVETPVVPLGHCRFGAGHHSHHTV